jgi:hypothetical protein
MRTRAHRALASVILAAKSRYQLLFHRGPTKLEDKPKRDWKNTMLPEWAGTTLVHVMLGHMVSNSEETQRTARTVSRITLAARRQL